MNCSTLRLAAATALLMGCFARASASVQKYTYETQSDGRRRMIAVEHESDVQPATGARSYDNWRFPGWNPPGQTSLFGTLALGTVEYGDDLQLAGWTPGKVNDIGWTFYNSSSTSRITSFGAAIRFYDDQFGLLGTDSAIYFGQTWGPGTQALFFTDGGRFRALNIYTRPSMYMSISFFDVVGGLDSDMGVLYGGPITIGNSSQYARNMTTGDLIDLGANPQANLGFFIDTVVPSPSSLSLITASSLFAFRRPRRQSAEC
jgi:hypothetical protein